jgi:hypothetical protein
MFRSVSTSLSKRGISKLLYYSGGGGRYHHQQQCNNTIRTLRRVPNAGGGGGGGSYALMQLQLQAVVQPKLLTSQSLHTSAIR